MIPLGDPGVLFTKAEHDALPWPPRHALTWNHDGAWVLQCRPDVLASWTHNVETADEIACLECREIERGKP